jgi:ABC-2 type transport system ATP-binding protein
MPAIVVDGVTHRYRGLTALVDVDLEVPEGALYALLGPNGAGKTTLLQIVLRLRHPTAGRVTLLGRDVSRLGAQDRALIGYVAEGQPLPGWMTLKQLEAYLAPLYPTWDHALAAELRRRFNLDPRKKISTLSRGEHMKAALLCSLTPRPRLLLMDEPFTGMDPLVKDELVRGLLESAGDEGWTVLICSHDIAEMEALADWVGFLDGGRIRLSEPMDAVRERFQRVDVAVAEGGDALTGNLPAEWLAVERSGPRLRFILSCTGGRSVADELRRGLPAGARIDVRPASLREVYLALAKTGEISSEEELR